MPPPPETRYRCGGFVVVRTPLLPRATFFDWAGPEVAARAGLAGAALEAAIDRDRLQLRERLRALVLRSDVAEALHVSSPSFSEKVSAWLEDPSSERSARLEGALIRFVERMGTRPTPFGLFAGITVVEPGPETQLRLGPMDSRRRVARIDLASVAALADTIGRGPALRAELRFQPNSSLYRVGDRFRYAEAVAPGPQGTEHCLVACDATPYLSVALSRASGGATPAEIAAAVIGADPDVALDEALEFVDELIDSQVLITTLAPTLTAQSPAEELRSALLDVPSAALLRERLAAIDAQLAALNEAPLGIDVAPYRRIAALFDDLTGARAAPRDASVGVRLGVQVELVKLGAPEARFGPRLADEALAAARLVNRVWSGDEDRLAPFKAMFEERHGAREVRLVDVLDSERGVGSAVRVAGLPSGFDRVGPVFGAEESATKSSWGPWHAFMLQLVGEALARGEQEILLSERDVQTLEAARTPLADSFAVHLSFVRVGNCGEASRASKAFVRHVSAPGAGQSLGRLAHASAELEAHVVRLAAEEQALHGEAIIAEVVHLPGGRTNNVVGRPSCGNYEIPYLCHSSAPPDRQIAIDDLMISVKGGRVVLRSARLGRTVIPRMTSSYVPDLPFNVDVYRFLGLLARQGTPVDLGWNWGPLGSARFLPRVVTDRQVLCPSRWRLQASDLEPLRRGVGSSFSTMQRLRERLRWPRFVSVTDQDRFLPVDLDNVLSVEAAVDAIAKHDGAIVVEMFEHDDLVRGPEGVFAHEIVVPFVKEPVEPPRAVEPRVAITRAEKVQRSFAPGSEWLYMKIYSGQSDANRILLEHLRPLIASWLASGVVDTWFFLRYQDPDPHLRLRFHGDPARLLTEVLVGLHGALGPLLAEGVVSRLQLDTYEREVERYGGDEGVRLFEAASRVESDSAIALLEVLRELDPDERWRVAFASIHALLTDFGLSPLERRAVLRRVSSDATGAPSASVSFVREVGAIYRRERAALERLASDSENAEWGPAIDLLRERSVRLRPILARLRDLAAQGVVTRGVSELAGAIVHMSLNRLLTTGHARMEPTLLALLGRLDESRAAREGSTRARR